MKKISMVLLLLVGVIILQACGNTNTQSTNSCDNNEIKIGVVTDTGGINDKSFNQGTWEGVQRYCSEANVGATVIESKAETDYIPNLTTLTDTEGIEVVVAIGEVLQNAVYEVAKDNPDTKYILIDGIPKDKNDNEVELENVQSFLFNEEQAGYLVGYIAGEMTETNKVGFIGGMEITPVQKFGWGYVQGVHAANPDAEVTYQYSGTFSDPTKGTQIADSMYNSGVDIIFSAAGGVNDGVLNSAKTKANSGNEVWVIGVDRDMYDDGVYAEDKSVVLTSAIKRVDQAAYQGLENAFSDSYKAGTVVLGYEDQGVGIPQENPNITNESIITNAENNLVNTNVENTLEGTQKVIGNMKITGNL